MLISRTTTPLSVCGTLSPTTRATLSSLLSTTSAPTFFPTTRSSTALRHLTLSVVSIGKDSEPASEPFLSSLFAHCSGAKINGHRGYFLTNDGVDLNQALINYGLDFLRKKSYKKIQAPFMMRKEIMAQTAQLEEFDEALYKVSHCDMRVLRPFGVLILGLRKRRQRGE